MNTLNTRRHLLPACLAAAVMTVLVGCADRNAPAETTPPPEPTLKSTATEAWDKTKEVAGDTYDSVKDATMNAANKLERATHDERYEIRASLAEAGAKFDTKLADWRTDGKTLSEENSKKISAAKTEFSKSLDELGAASADGWAAAKAKTAAAWEKLKIAYDDATTN